MLKDVKYEIVRKILFFIFIGIYTIFLLIMIIDGDEPYVDVEDDSYSIKSCDITAQIGRNSEIHVEQTITADFHKAGKGIQWFVDTMFERKDGSRQLVRISDVEVNGKEPYYYETDGVAEIPVKDQGKKSKGLKTYRIEYDLDMDIERADDADLFSLMIIGQNNPFDIEEVNCHLIFEKLTQKNVVNLGRNYSVKDVTREEVKDDELHVYGDFAHVKGGEDISVYAKLPGGYFTPRDTSILGEEDIIVYYVFMGICIAVVLALVIYRIWYRTGNESNENLEMYPPDGVDALQAGVIVDEKIMPRHIMASILWLLNHNYLGVWSGENPKEIVYQGLGIPDNNVPEYIRDIHYALTGSNGYIRSEGVSQAFHSCYDWLYKSVRKFFTGRHKLYFTNIIQYIFLGIAAFFSCMGIYMLGGDFSSTIMYAAFIVLFYIPAWGCYRCCTIGSDGYPGTKEDKWNLLWLLGYLPFVWAVMRPGFASVINRVMVCVLPLVFIFLLPYCRMLTGKNKKSRRQMEGLARFIMNVEPEQMRELFDADPDYYFQILPYAYAIGLSDCWTDKCRGLVHEYPLWLMEGSHNFSWQIWEESFVRIQGQLQVELLHDETTKKYGAIKKGYYK